MSATDRYRHLVANDELTCQACPVQWEGRLVDGRYFYFRYRSGWASLALGQSAEVVAGVTDHGMRIGDYLAGSMTDAEYHRTFLELLDEVSG